MRGVSVTEEAPKKARIYCNYCKQETNHDLKGEHTVKSFDDDSQFGEMTAYRLWFCMGCERGVLQLDYSNSEMYDGNDDRYLSDISYYPERSQLDLTPKPYAKLKPKLAGL